MKEGLSEKERLEGEVKQLKERLSELEKDHQKSTSELREELDQCKINVSRYNLSLRCPDKGCLD